VSLSPSVQVNGSITAIVVTYQSAAVIRRCLESLRCAAPRRGVVVLVADNASMDGSATISQELLNADHVIRLAENRGFAAGVNAALGLVATPWIALVNPDTVLPPGSLDQLVDILEANPRAALIGPRVRDDTGRAERTVGRFPTLPREWVHSLLLDRLGLEGRIAPFPRRTDSVDWVSACVWLLRANALRQVGLLDEAYFMYGEDVDYCRQLRDSNWEVLATPLVEVMHSLGRGSTATDSMPADGGRSLIHYFAKFHADVPERRIRSILVRGWKLRRVWRLIRAQFGDERSARIARRYLLAVQALDGP